MAITSTAYGNDSGVASLTVATGSGAGTPTPANLAAVTGQPIIGCYVSQNGGTISSVTDTVGNTYTVLTPETTFGPTCVIFYCASSVGTNASNVITVTLTVATVSVRGVMAITGTGFDTGTFLLDSKNGNAAGATSVSPGSSLNCGTSDALIFAADIASNDREFDTSASCTEIYDLGSATVLGRSGQGQYKSTTGGGAQSISAAVTGGVSSNLQTAQAAFKLLPSAPTINTQPVSQTCYVTQTVTYTISATASAGGLSYQWKDDGSNVGTNSSSYTTAAATLTDNNSVITCVVTDSNGSTTSAPAFWFVLPVSTVGWLRA